MSIGVSVQICKLAAHNNGIGVRQESSPQSPMILYRQTLAFIVNDKRDDRMIKEFLLHKNKKENGNPPHIQAHLVSASSHEQNDRQRTTMAQFHLHASRGMMLRRTGKYFMPQHSNLKSKELSPDIR